MHFKLCRALRVLCLPVLLLCFSHVKAAEPAKFSGTYRLTNIVEDNAGVHFTMTLKLFNPGNTDVRGGIVAMLDSSPRATLLGSFNTIQLLPRLGQIKVTKEFTISEAEYARWHQGHDPVVQFLLPGEDGAMTADVQVHRILNPGESAN